MDGQAIVDHLEDAYETELSRLGSSKAMYAVTDGEMDTEAVIGAMADRAVAAAETFEAWADAGGPLAGRFREAAGTARDHAERLAAQSDEVEPTDSPTPLETYLRGLDSDAERFAGFIAWAEVTDRTLSQAVGFFVGNADTRAANLFRDLRSEVEGLLDGVDSDAPAVEDAPIEETAGRAVQVAYEHYVETLEGMGIKVKPVC